MKPLNNDDYNSLQEIIRNWITWLYTRNFYTAPLPKNILAMLQQERSKTNGEPPNAKNSALCCAFNMVMQQAHDSEPDMLIPFMYVYFKEYRPEPIKSLAFELNIDTDTVYQRAHKVAPKYYNQTLKLQELNAMMQKEVSGLVDYD